MHWYGGIDHGSTHITPTYTCTHTTRVNTSAHSSPTPTQKKGDQLYLYPPSSVIGGDEQVPAKGSVATAVPGPGVPLGNGRDAGHGAASGFLREAGARLRRVVRWYSPRGRAGAAPPAAPIRGARRHPRFS